MCWRGGGASYYSYYHCCRGSFLLSGSGVGVGVGGHPCYLFVIIVVDWVSMDIRTCSPTCLVRVVFGGGRLGRHEPRHEAVVGGRGEGGVGGGHSGVGRERVSLQLPFDLVFPHLGRIARLALVLHGW